MKKAFQFRIYPNKNQEVKLNKTLSTCRRLYNDSLAERERQAELNRLKKEFEVFPWGKPEWINYYDQANDLSGSKTDFQKEVFSQVLQNVRNGEQIEPPEFLRESEKKLTQEQKRLSRKKKRSQNRDHQRIVVAKVHRKIRNQRKDFTHKTSRMLVEEYDHIVFENLQVQNMVQNYHLAKSISDAGWSQLINFTKTKAEYAGKIVELVDPRNTSQNCSSCGNSVPKDLSIRTHSCPFCGLELDRDHNAAINILRRSKNTVGTTGINACQGSLDRGSMQQEAPTLQGE